MSAIKRLGVVVTTPIAQIGDRKARTKLAALCELVRALSDEIAALEAAKVALKPDLHALCERLGVAKVAGDGWLLLRNTRTTSRIDATRLIEKGVSMATVKYATVTKESAPYYEVRARKSDTNMDDDAGGDD